MTAAVATTIRPADLAARMAAGEPCDLLDVRTLPEFAAVHAAGARHIPLDALRAENARVGRSLPAEAPVYILCKSGGRAKQAQSRLAEACTAIVVEGGTDAWVAAGLPHVRGEARVWPLQRQAMFAAGMVLLLGVALTYFVHPYFLALPAFVGVGLLLAGGVDFCLMAVLLSRMPWNRGAKSSCSV